MATRSLVSSDILGYPAAGRYDHIGPTSTPLEYSTQTWAARLPTPPLSEPSPAPEFVAATPFGAQTTVPVATAFFPTAEHDACEPDLVLVSADGVHFYTHSHRLLAASENAFGRRLPCGSRSLSLPESSTILNLVLHGVYNLPCIQYSASFANLAAAVAAATHYGLPAHTLLAPNAPLAEALLTLTPLHPLDIYTLAAEHDIYHLAKAASAYLLSFPLHSLSDETAARMGGVYVKRLFFLHLGRVEALKRLLITPPQAHAPTAKCSFEEQKGLTRAWALAAAYLSWEAKPDLSASTLSSAFSSLASTMRCPKCQAELVDHVRRLVLQWSLVKVRIGSF